MKPASNSLTKMKNFSEKLLRWFDASGRKDLPWQTNKTAYRVWVSEIMLQQTQVKTAIPFYEKFMGRFDTVENLAKASIDEVLHFWSGLGYYARARNLHKTAKIVANKHRGSFPNDLTELISLPGIGRSTAGAIIAISTGDKATILDGNVKRVISRLFGLTVWPGVREQENALWEIAHKLTPDSRVSDYTQAIMDFGATLCTRAKPNCLNCPFKKICKAHSLGIVERCPGRKPKKKLPVKRKSMLLICSSKKFLLEKRNSEGLWGGLWTFPECDPEDLEIRLAELKLNQKQYEMLPIYRHSFSHFHLDISPVKIEVEQTEIETRKKIYRWVSVKGLTKIGIPRPTENLMKKYAF